jgi:hypothetical protein
MRMDDPGQRSELMTTRHNTLTALLLACVPLLVWTALVPGTYPRNAWIFSWDSAAYIETATSILDGRGFLQRAIDGLGDEIWQPMLWWPPGYSIAIAVVTKLTGLSLHTAGLAISLIAAGLSVLVIGFFAVRLFGRSLGLPLAVAIAAMPAFLQISTQYMSDSLFYLCAALSVLCVYLWTEHKDEQRLYLLGLAGFFAGASWTVRYVGSSLLLASFLFLGLHFLWLRGREVVRAVLVWGIGVSVCFIPLAARNIIYYGKLNPYNMPPSELGLRDNVSRMVSVAVTELTTAPASIVDWIVSFDRLLIVSLVVLTVLYLGLMKRPRSLPAALEAYRVELFLAGYALIYGAVVVYARTTYRWGELIDRRHFVQIAWIVLFFAALWSLRVFRTVLPRPQLAQRLAVVLLVVLAGLQLRQQFEFLQKPPVIQADAPSHLDPQAAERLKTEVGPNQIVLSTRADLLRIHLDLNARKIPPVSQYDFLSPLTRDDIRRHGERGFLWGLVVEDLNGARKGEYDDLIRDIVARPEAYPEFERIDSGGKTLVLKYKRSADALAQTHNVTEPQ